MVFFTFASQERAAAEYFSEGAKTESEESDDPFPWALQQILVGPSNQPEQKGSILWSPTQRHSIVRNMIGRDLAVHTGTGMNVVLDSDLVADADDALPGVDNNFDGEIDSGTDFGDPVDALSRRINFVDALAAWGKTFGQSVEGSINDRRDYLGANAMPEPDVDYTYPDINHLFLGYHGWSIRDNGVAASPRYERIEVLIPSFFRPQYMKSAIGQGPNGVDVPTDPDWYDESVNPTHEEYAARSFRPHAFHVAGFSSTGSPVRRFLDATNPAHAVAIAALPGSSGAFPLRRGEGNAWYSNSVNYGRLGVWTGDVAAPPNEGKISTDVFELDSDNDGDGVREGIWLDLRYPLQETADGRKYAVLHSFTIYDLDGRIDLNSHGNLAGLERQWPDLTTLAGTSRLASTFLSQSNLGVGPHEVNPMYALAPLDGALSTNPAFNDWYGNGMGPPENPTTIIEQANMELVWLLTGRIDTTGASPEVIDGRWGDASALWYHRFTGGNRRVNSLPRPGRAGTLSTDSTNLIENFGGKQGLDDNQDVLEGIASTVTGRQRGQIHPTDFAGRGKRTGTDADANDFRSPRLSPQSGTLPERWPRYLDYPVVGNATTIANNATYIAGQDGSLGTTADNLLTLTDPTNASNFNANYEDPYEVVIDHDRALRPDDQIFAIQDLISAHLTKTDADNATGLSDRLEKLAPVTFDDNSDRSKFFTTLTNSFRHFAMMHDTRQRPWEWTADSDGDTFMEFPPQFYDDLDGNYVPNQGTDTLVPLYSLGDPFRPQTRRLLFVEATEGRGVLGQLPLSLNHILDVDRNAQTPLEGTPAFQNFMRRSGLRFRPITEHPMATDLDASGIEARSAVTAVPNVAAGTALPVFPPQNLADREFWARRDRQQLARDIYVLLYTIGGAENSGSSVINYTTTNEARALYTDERMRLMAQFAVNVVDAMDSDNVITRFEFDKDLGDGWNMDDDPYTATAVDATNQWNEDGTLNLSGTPDPADTTNGLYIEDGHERGVVYGVEAQQLAISEVLGIRSAELAMGDHPDATLFDDADDADPTRHNDFLFVELQNILPASLDLGSGLLTGETVDKTVWRLARYDRTTAASPVELISPLSAATAPKRILAFANDTTGANTVDGGGRFSISMTTAAGTPSSDFFVDTGVDGGTTFDGTFELIAPYDTVGTLPTTSTPPNDPAFDPRADLDLVAHAALNREYQVGGGFLDAVETYTGNIPLAQRAANTTNFDGSPPAGALNVGFDLVLQRRLNPDLPSMSPADNPWVTVDVIRVNMANFNLSAPDDDAAEVRDDAETGARLRNVRSLERSQPLQDLRTIFPLPPSGTALTSITSSLNSVKGRPSPAADTAGTNHVTTTAGNGFTLWQPHFDREFVSPGELLNIPMFGPGLLTQRLASSRLPPYQQLGAGTPNVANIAGANAMFLWPDLTPDVVGTDPSTANDNRWYRFFQFVEVPSRVNRMLGNYVSLKRLPGKLNPNTIAEREIYAGLIDDTHIMNLPPLNDSANDGSEDGPFSAGNASNYDGVDGIRGTGTNRDRWHEFVNERDGLVNSVIDPTPLFPGSGDEVGAPFWIPGAANSRPFRSFSHRQTSGDDDNGLESTLLRRLAMDKPAAAGSARTNVAGEGSSYNTTTLPVTETNRHWLEIGDRDYHDGTTAAPAATSVEHHQMLSKIMNNTTTVSNTFIMYGTAAYFEVYEDPATGLNQVGGRMGLDLDGDSDPLNDAGWEQRAVFIVDRTELFNAYDPGSGSVDWKRLVKHRVNLSSDGR